MRLTLISAVLALFLLALVAGAPFAADDVPSALVETDILNADEDVATTVDGDQTQVLSERESPRHRHSHASVDEAEDHNRGHHSQRASKEDKAIRHPTHAKHAPHKPQRTAHTKDESGEQSDWRQYVPEAYRKYLPDESSTAPAASYSHKKSSHYKSHSKHSALVDDAAVDDETADVQVAEDGVVAMDVSAEKVAVVQTTSSVTWFLLFFVVVLLSAAAIALAAFIGNKKQTDYAPLPTREIY